MTYTYLLFVLIEKVAASVSYSTVVEFLNRANCLFLSNFLSKINITYKTL